MGQRDMRRLLIIGASVVVTPIARIGAARKGAPQDSWLARMMMAKDPLMVVVVAFANKMARTVWALSVRETTYTDPAIF
jgi:transposase